MTYGNPSGAEIDGRDDNQPDMTTEHTGTGDPARSLALLWRTHERANRRGRTDLTVDRIIHAAIEVADADGLPGLSMRRIAERLGVGTMSLYTHLPGKAELLDLMLDTVYADVPDTDTTPRDWRTRVEQIARDAWARYHRHPWMLQIGTSRPVLGPNAMARYEHELRAIDGIGLTDIEMDSVVNLVAGHVASAARQALDATSVEQRTGMTDEQWWSARAPLLDALTEGHHYPTAARVGATVGEAYGSAVNPVHAFEFGLHRLLDGIDALIRDRHDTGGSRPTP
ncbi:AcrR family transcriptional regulator [Plantactinospora soyae]|uniref:AcrR family transcriptional regulator n=2 Tax=Plantactinospora soyae TaxID=1544732 RepID=A0A927M975_9ACTN|nr:TetR/AcrR family transcriptional regulator [Plantactinospora soyae]MBE1490488.1 AcrR family transcriptional regulator [Plantactinospora soyae]